MDSSCRETGERAFDGEDNSTNPGARRFSLSLLADEGDDEVGLERDVAPTMRRERSGAT